MYRPAHPESALAPIAPRIQTRLMRARGSVRAGEASASFQILDGAVMKWAILAGGRRQILDVAGPGEVFVLSGSDRDEIGAQALLASRLVELTTPGGSGTSASDPYAEGLLGALERSQRHALVLGSGSALKRVAFALLRLNEVMSPGAEAFDCPMTRRDLADWLGLVIETVSRSLTRLQDARMIDVIEHHRFVIRKRAELAALAWS
jgi:CRP-like cAMP-binding protein